MELVENVMRRFHAVNERQRRPNARHGLFSHSPRLRLVEASPSAIVRLCKEQCGGFCRSPPRAVWGKGLRSDTNPTIAAVAIAISGPSAPTASHN